METTEITVDNFEDGTFRYPFSAKVIYYQGQVLDSLLELKYILSIEDTHAWLRDGLENYYNIDENLHRYKPDFLIRNWQTGEALMMEVKPSGYNDKWAMREKRKITEKFIREFGFNIRFDFVFSSQIHLEPTKQEKLLQILNDQHHWQHKPCLHLLQNETHLTDEAYRRFVWEGVLPASVH